MYTMCPPKGGRKLDWVAMGVRPGALRCRTCSSTSSVSTFLTPCARPGWSYDELRSTVQSALRRQFRQVERALRNHDPCNTGLVLRAELKQVLRTFCLPLTVEQFECLLAADCCLDSASGKVRYRYFMEKLAGWTCSRDPPCDDGCSPSLTIDEVEHLLKATIQTNMKTIVKAFVMYDYARDGFIQKKELRRILDSFCFKMSEKQFNALWQRHDPHYMGMISYDDFLIKVGIYANLAKPYIRRDSVAMRQDRKQAKYDEIKKTLHSSRQPLIECPDDPSVKGKTLDEIMAVAKGRMQETGMDAMLGTAFSRHDPFNTGFVYAEDFHGVLNQYVLPMSRGTFMHFLSKCYPNENAPETFNYKDFIYTFCKLNKAVHPQFHSHPYCLPQVPMLKRVKYIIKKIKRHTVNMKNILMENLTLMNFDGATIFTRWELRRAFENIKLFLSEDELKDLFAFLDPANINKITIQSFLDVFEYQDPPVEQTFIVPELMLQSRYQGYPKLRGLELRNKLRSYVTRAYDGIRQALLSIDRGNGRVPQRRLRNIIEEFCFGLTDDQWLDILGEHRMIGEELYYQPLLNQYQKALHEDTDHWMHDACKLLSTKYRHLQTLEHREYVAHVREWVRANGKAFLSACARMDKTCSGSIEKDDFRRLVNLNVLRLNRVQFDALWREVPRDNCGNLAYNAFVHDFSQCPKP